MKAITICQPYPYLILLPDSDPRMKRVENRTWPTSHRGPLLIHAGKSRDWLEIERDADGYEFDANYDIALKDMPFGALVARCNLVACLHIDDIKCVESAASRGFPWLRSHRHVNGPWCWVLADIVPLAGPIPWRGAQGLFDVPGGEIT